MAQRGFEKVPIVAGTIISIRNLSNVRKRQIVSRCLAAVHDVPNAADRRTALREGRKAVR